MPSKGVNSTEFWLTLLSAAMLVANGTSFIEIPWDIFIGWLSVNGVYTGARTVEKVAVHKRNGTGDGKSTPAPTTQT